MAGPDVLETETEDLVAAALARASFPPLIHACGYRFDWSTGIGDVLKVLLIIDSTEWDADADQACLDGRRVGREALDDTVAEPVIFTCRNREEQNRFAANESGLWTNINLDGTC